MLYELIYRSKATDDITDNDLKEILAVARKFNGENGITGCLLYNNKQFLQLIEGEFDTLMALYEKIKTDERHEDVLLLHMRETEYRIYPEWTMAFKSLDETELTNNAGVTQFTEFEESKDDQILSKQLFTAIGNDLN